MKLKLNPLLFWDCDFSKIDFENNHRFVIERVLERGSMADWFEIKRHYGMEKIKQAVLTSRYLNRKVLSFCCAVFDLKKENFRCYKLQQSNPGLWQL